MKVMILGARGIPSIEGGVEMHVERLAPLLVEQGIQVEVLGRSPYKGADGDQPWKGVTRKWLWSQRHLEALLNSFVGVLYAAIHRPDVLHIHAIGPSIVAPLARLAGLRVVTTHHGFDYDREKWGKAARLVLRLGEWAGARFSNVRIVISKTIQDRMESRFGKPCRLIPNGVSLPEATISASFLRSFGLTEKKYILQVSRFVPEKRQLDLIEAFGRTKLVDWKLVLVGGLNDQTQYIRKVQSAAGETPGVVLTGFQSGECLHQLFVHAGAFVLPSSHEGLPIALLEALSYGLPCIASDISAHREIDLDMIRLFPCGDVATLAELLIERSHHPATEIDIARSREFVRERYDWHQIAAAVAMAYEEATHPAPTM